MTEIGTSHTTSPVLSFKPKTSPTADVSGEEGGPDKTTPSSREYDDREGGSPKPTITPSSSSSSPLDHNSTRLETEGGRSVPTSSSSSCDDSCSNATEESFIYLKWGGKVYTLSFSPIDFQTFTIKDLKCKIEFEFDIPTSRQKFIGLTSKSAKGPPADDELLVEVKWANAKRYELIVIGTARSEQVFGPPDVDELDIDIDDTTDAWIDSDIKLQTRYESCLDRLEIRWIEPARPDRKLLVLDLDYTLFDCKVGGVEMQYCRRPYLDYFMRRVYEFYDIVIWSQTGWHWVELKCTELGLLSSHDYRVCFVLDRSSMFTVTHPKKRSYCQDQEVSHEVKCLKLIWSKCRNHWNPKNTIHVDDLARNFVLNPKNGLKVSAYRSAKRRNDEELYYLSHYLCYIANQCSDFRTINHRQWKDATLAYAAQGHVPNPPDSQF